MSPITSPITGAAVGRVRLRGYRCTDECLLHGGWPAGELLGFPVPGRPALVPPTVIEPPRDRASEVCVAPGAGVVRFAEIDWVHRRARLEIGLAESPHHLTGTDSAGIAGSTVGSAGPDGADDGDGPVGIDAAGDLAGRVLRAALEHGFGVLNLRRLYGWVTPAARTRPDLLIAAGLRREAVVPAAGWLAGEPVGREIWGVLRDGREGRTDD